jgi:hypothetical protein
VADRTGLRGRFDLDLELDLNWDHLVGDAPEDTLGSNEGSSMRSRNNSG